MFQLQITYLFVIATLQITLLSDFQCELFTRVFFLFQNENISNKNDFLVNIYIKNPLVFQCIYFNNASNILIVTLRTHKSEQQQK